MIEPGTLIASKYRVERCLGKGGMGYVLKAVHEHLGESVAIKFMIPELSRHPEAVARFLREARAAFRIKSEHVARVLDAGEHEGAPYMVMEFLAGHDLAKELEQRRHLPPHEAADFIIQVCDALAVAHALGIVHRDLKPSNLFLTRRSDGAPFVKVLDFGISKALDDPDAPPVDSLTVSHRLLGSPHYMSPEQARAPKTVDERSDIWSLGVVLFELVTGKKPFDGDTPVAVLASLLSDPVPCLQQEEVVGTPLLAVIRRCLQRSPADRYVNVGELATALLPVATPRSAPLVHRIEAAVHHAADPLSPTLIASGTGSRLDEKTLLSAGSSTLRDGAASLRVPLVSPRSSYLLPVLFGLAIVGAVSLSILLRRESAPAAAALKAAGTATTVRASSAPALAQQEASARVPAPALSASATGATSAPPRAPQPPNSRVRVPLPERSQATGSAPSSRTPAPASNPVPPPRTTADPINRPD